MLGVTLLFLWLGIVSGVALVFPVEASQVAGLQEIRKFGLTGILIPEATKLRQDYLDAVNYAKSRPCGVVTMSQLEDCSTCMMENCINRAKHVCTTNRFFQARATIEQFISNHLPTLLSPGIVDLSADEALSEYADFIEEYQAVRRKRSSDIAPPFCQELRQNHTACAFFLPQCPCSPLCVNYLRALEAKRRFLHAVPGFLRGYSVEMFKLDLTTFDHDLGGFTLAKVRVVLDGETYEFSAEHPTLPYNPRSTGQLIAEQALKEYYRKYPSRQTPLSAISK